MSLQCLLHEGQRDLLVSGFGDLAAEDLALVIDRAPQIMVFAVDLHGHFVEMPSPPAEASHVADLVLPHFTCERRAEAVPPEADGLVTQIDAAFEQQALDVPQRQRETHIHQDHQADDLRR